MESYQLTIAQKELIEDLKSSFNIFLLEYNPQEINRIWQNLYHAKQEGWFEQEFYTYWLVKCINTPNAQGACILCLSSITKDICGFDEKQLGDFLAPRINFIIGLGDFGAAIDIINFSLQGSAIFEKAWLINKLDQLNIDDKFPFLKINNQNEAIFFNSSL